MLATKKYKNADKLCNHDKFIMVLETANLSEIKFSEYCWEWRIYSEQVKEWQEVCMNTNENSKVSQARASKGSQEERKAKKKLEKELARKEKVLAEAVVLLVLKKSKCDLWNGQRGRMINTCRLQQAVELIEEVVDVGVVLYKACNELIISKRSYNHWRNSDSDYIDKRAICVRREPANS